MACLAPCVERLYSLSFLFKSLSFITDTTSLGSRGRGRVVLVEADVKEVLVDLNDLLVMDEVGLRQRSR